MTVGRDEREPPSRIRIVQLIGQLGLGGSERQLTLLARHLDRRRFELHIVVFNDSPHLVLDRELESLGARVWPVPRPCRSIPRRIVFLARLLRALRPDVVHSWSVPSNAYAQVAGRLAGVRVRLGSLRGGLASGARGRRAYRFLSLDILPYLVVNSRAAARELERAGRDPGRTFLLPNGVELPPANRHDGRGATLREDLALSPGDPLIGTVGNLREVKNQLMFVEAMAGVLARHPRARALVIGQELPSEPDVPRRLAARIEELDLGGRVILTGFLPDVLEWISRLDVLCLTSRSEGMPNSILEAMAARRPVVATRVGGIPEIVRHGEDGFLVELGDVAGFTRAVDRLLAEPELARRMGEAGRRRVEAQFSCAAAARRLERLYLRLLDPGSGDIGHG